MVSTEELVSPRRKYFNVNLKYLFVVGLWPQHEWSRYFKPKYYKMYEINLHILSGFFLILTTIGLSGLDVNKMEILMSNLDKTLIGYSFVLKVISFKISQRDLQLLVTNIMNSGDKVTKKCNNRMTTLLIVVTTVIVMIFSAFSLSALYEGEVTVEAWMPFDPLKNRWSLLMAVQIIAITFVVPCALRGIGLQGLICSLGMYLCEQLKEIQVRIRRLEYRPDMDSMVREELKDILRKHVRLIGYSKTMERAFQHYFLVHNVAMSVEMCLNALMVSIIGSQDPKMLLNFLSFLGIALLNTYIYCYLGNEIIIQSNGISIAAYEAPWTSWPVDMQKDLLTVIRLSQKPLKLSAGGVSVISLKTYSQIIYHGYSIFTMLHDMM